MSAGSQIGSILLIGSFEKGFLLFLRQGERKALRPTRSPAHAELAEA